MNNEMQHFDLNVTRNDRATIGYCIPTEMEPETFIEKARVYNAGMVGVDNGSSRHRTLLMRLMGLDKDALFSRVFFYSVTGTDVQLIRSLALQRG